MYTLLNNVSAYCQVCTAVQFDGNTSTSRCFSGSAAGVVSEKGYGCTPEVVTLVVLFVQLEEPVIWLVPLHAHCNRRTDRYSAKPEVVAVVARLEIAGKNS